ncbi:MAG TPA: AzlD domain-containing protein [Burkholderiaceae bacterium]|nr:AzlD domain-containing protein [Burkholderiaceae bacterium]
MTPRLELLPLLFAVTLSSFACRVGGFRPMRFVEVTSPIQAALRAAPLAVMVGIVVPAAVRGATAEWLGLAATIPVMRVPHRDLVAALAGVATVAVCRLAFG